MTARSRRTTGDVYWRVPGRKRPVAYSTRATSDLIVGYSEEGHTFASARVEIRWDQEAHTVLDTFIGLGHGDQPMRTFGVR